MKLVIDIDENLLEGIKSDDFDFARQVVKNFQATIASAIANGTSIPNNATNGDYVKAIMKAGMIHSVLFEENAKVDDEEFVCMYYEGKIIGDFDLNWWNSTYQKGGKE